VPRVDEGHVGAVAVLDRRRAAVDADALQPGRAGAAQGLHGLAHGLHRGLEEGGVGVVVQGRRGVGRPGRVQLVQQQIVAVREPGRRQVLGALGLGGVDQVGVEEHHGVGRRVDVGLDRAQRRIVDADHHRPAAGPVAEEEQLVLGRHARAHREGAVGAHVRLAGEAGDDQVLGGQRAAGRQFQHAFAGLEGQRRRAGIGGAGGIAAAGGDGQQGEQHDEEPQGESAHGDTSPMFRWKGDRK